MTTQFPGEDHGRPDSSRTRGVNDHAERRQPAAPASRRRWPRRLAAIAAVAAAVGACGGGTGAPGEFTIEHAWARPTPTGATNGVIYLDVIADRDDTVIGASVEPAVAASATLHATVTRGGGEMSSHHGDDSEHAEHDMSTMEDTDAIELAAGDGFSFSPGGNHIMLTGLTKPLLDGATFNLTLQLGSGRAATAEVVVANNPPTT